MGQNHKMSGRGLVFANNVWWTLDSGSGKLVRATVWVDSSYSRIKRIRRLAMLRTLRVG